jgi:hypothetical protein
LTHVLIWQEFSRINSIALQHALDIPKSIPFAKERLEIITNFLTILIISDYISLDSLTQKTISSKKCGFRLVWKEKESSSEFVQKKAAAANFGIG